MNAMTAPEINVEHLMHQIRQGLTARDNASATLAANHASGDEIYCRLAELASSLDRIATDTSPAARTNLALSTAVATTDQTPLLTDEQHGHHVRDFLSYEGVEFISNAYEALLRRKVDGDGLNCYLAMLRAGASKVEILGRIAQSSEAKQDAVRVRGLGFAYFLDAASRWPVIGRALGITVAIWNLPAAERRARRLSSELAYQFYEVQREAGRARHEIYQALGVLQDSQNQLADFASTMASRDHADALQKVLAKVIGVLQALERNNASKLGQDAFEFGISDLRAQIQQKADQVSLADLHLQLQSVSATKADGQDLERSFRDISALRTEAERLAESLATLQASKADAATLQNFNHSLLRAIETKSERHEATALANHLITLVEQRATKHDLQALALAISEANISIADVGRQKADTRDLQALALAISEANTSIADVGRQKADTRDLQALALAISEANTSIADVGRQKADTRDLHALRSALEKEARVTSDGVNLTLQNFARTKADQSSIATLREELTVSLGTAMDTSEKCWRESLSDLAQKLTSLGVQVSSHIGADTMKTEIVSHVEAARTRLNEALDKLSDTKADRVLVEELRAELRDRMANHQKNAIEALDKALSPLHLRADDLRRQVIDQDRRVGLLLEEARKRFPKPISTGQIGAMLLEDDHRLDAMYARFEDQFRGTRADIRRRQAIYTPYVRNSKAGTSNAPVIDIGCGRGEWLELLRDEGLVAKGVDLNRVFLDGCRETEPRSV
jgi:hypothetical protein